MDEEENNRLSDTGADGSTLDAFLNLDFGVIGRTASTRFEPNTSGKFFFWLSKLTTNQQGAFTEIAPIEIGNIVAALSDEDEDIAFGMVTEMRSYSDMDSFIADYLSHDFGNATIDVPTDISEVVVVTCSVMKSISLRAKPVGRSRVYYPSALGIQFAYGIVDSTGATVYRGAPIPCGIFQNGDGTAAPISVDEDFLLGPEGAHLNVSGISGLAAKTSAIEFVIKSLLTHTSKRVAVVMFNVKSQDLLYADQPNPRIAADDWSRGIYSTMGLTEEPFTGAHFFAPADPNRPGGTQSLRRLATTPFEWDLQMIYQQIPTLFDPLDWDDKMEGVWFSIHDDIERGQYLTYAQMLQGIEYQINQANQHQQQWIRSNHISTWQKMLSHLRRFPRSYQGLITTAGQGGDIPWNQLAENSVYVIDIQMLADRAQRLVFGRAVTTLSDMLESGMNNLDAVIIFVDELNKFAPSGSIRSPLKTRLIDITARGRSIGLVLFGAEQFISSVDKEIVENSSTYLIGRTETNELRTPTFSALSDEIKNKLTMLPQGQLLIKFAKFPQSIFIKFPFPPCCPGDQYRAPVAE